MRLLSLTACGVWAYNLTIYAQKRHSLKRTTPTQENRLKTANNAPQIARKSKRKQTKDRRRPSTRKTTKILRPFPKSNTIEHIVKSCKNRSEIWEEKNIKIVDIEVVYRGVSKKLAIIFERKFFKISNTCSHIGGIKIF